jgi:hypothetical protein
LWAATALFQINALQAFFLIEE